MIDETLDETAMHIPLVISDGDAEDDDNSSSNSIKENGDIKITQRQQKLVVLMTILVILEMIISYYVNIKEVSVWVRVDGGDKFNLIVFSTFNAVRYCYLILGLAGFFFFKRLNRTSKKRFQFLTLLLIFCHVVLIAMKFALLIRDQYK